MKLICEEVDVYVIVLVYVDLEGGGDDDVVCKLVGDMIVVGFDYDEVIVCCVLVQQMIEVCCQLMEVW